MGLLDGLLGNASEIEPSKIEGDFAQVMAPGEQIEGAYQLIRDCLSLRTSVSFSLTSKASLATRSNITPFGG